MNDDANMMNDIALGESWLAGHLEDRPFSGTERVRRRVRIELGERWLRTQPDVRPTAGLGARVRAAMRAELARRVSLTPISRSATAARVPGHRVRTMLRVAAAVGFMLLAATPMNRIGSPTVGNDDHALTWEIIAMAIRVPLSEEDQALASVRRELDLLEQSVREPDAPINTEDFLLRDVDDELDRMMRELGSDANT